jgi:hypothetical protein
MSYRAAYYWYQDLQDPKLAKRYHLVEGRSRDSVRHRMLVPRTWLPISPLKVEGQTLPLSALLENPELGERSASISVCVVTQRDPRDAAVSAVTELGLTLHDWTKDENGGTGRALGGDMACVVGVRRYLGSCYVIVAFAPRDRFRGLYLALNNAVMTFSLCPSWAFEEGEVSPW